MQKDDYTGSISATPESAHHTWWTRALLILAPVFFGIDVWCKWRVTHMPTGVQGTVAGIELLHNTRLFIWVPVPAWLLLVLTSVVFFAALALWIYSYGKRSGVQSAALALILWGGASNLIDRIRFGATIDYLRIFDVVANIADFLIIAGILLLFLWPRTFFSLAATSNSHTKSS